METLNLFYREPDPDRWFRYDRYPRRIIRRLARGKHRPGGVMMVALELMKGLDKIKAPYRFNDFSYARRHTDELACIIGKPNVLYHNTWKNPVLFGAGTFSHPVDCPDLLTKYPAVKKILVPGEWMRSMFEPWFGEQVQAWPVGIDTEKWNKDLKANTLPADFLIYDKIRWEREHYRQSLIEPILSTLSASRLSYDYIRYGSYSPPGLMKKLSACKAVIFLCEHETQGLAYQQILSTGTPVLAWDRGGYWKDPHYYPDRVKFGPVTSVPYWDERCGMKFAGTADFEEKLELFCAGNFSPREYILENLTLEIAARAYVGIVKKLVG